MRFDGAPKMPSLNISPELGYVLLVLGLFLVPRLLQRFRLPGAITSVALGAILGMGFHVLQDDATIEWLGTLGIVALFLFAGLEVDFEELRRGARVVTQHVALQAVLLAFAAVGCAATLGLHDREATLLALALFTPSTGFIFDSLGAFGLDAEKRFWVKSKAIASEIVALVILFVTVQSTDARTLLTSTGALVLLVALLPWVFRVFSTKILPHAPRSEFTFLVIVALLSAFLTLRLGVYYLVGAFVVGVTAVRMRSVLPGLVSEKVLGAIELFASFFVPFYFLKAGLHLSVEDFSTRALLIGAAFLVLAVPLRVGVVVLHRRWVLGEAPAEAARVGLSLVPTLVFTMVIANILVERYHVERAIYGALLVFCLGNTLLPGLLLRASIEVGSLDEEPNAAASPAFGDEDGGTGEGASGEDTPDLSLLDGTLTALEEPVVTPLGQFARRVQDSMFAWIVGRGIPREGLIATRLHQIAPNAGRFWAALVVSSSLGAVGVLVDSVSLVVAAAIASPLVAPIGGLGLGLAAGSPFLVLRTFLRGALALLTSIGVATLVTRLVPYAVAPEIFRPHAPTLLDFAAAAACALVAVLSEVRAGSASYVIAARAAVGHVVVVPACVAGFAMGTGAWASFGVTVWALLANVATVVVVSIVAFILLGMHHVDAARVERRELEGMVDSPALAALLRPLQRVFASRWAVVLRVLMPLTLLLLASIPLRRALDEVTRDVRSRDAVRRAVAQLPGRVLETRVEVGASSISVAALQVGDARQAREARATLERLLARSVRGRVYVDVVAVPDSAALATLEDQLQASAPRRGEQPDMPTELARVARAHAETLLGATRSLLGVSVHATGEGYEVRVEWVGDEPSRSEREGLDRVVQSTGGPAADARVISYSSAEVTFDPRDAVGLAQLFARAETAASTSRLVLCVRRAAQVPSGRRTRAHAEQSAASTSLDAALGHRTSVELLDSDRFSHRFAVDRCSEPAAPALPSR